MTSHRDIVWQWKATINTHRNWITHFSFFISDQFIGGVRRFSAHSLSLSTVHWPIFSSWDIVIYIYIQCCKMIFMIRHMATTIASECPQKISTFALILDWVVYQLRNLILYKFFCPIVVCKVVAYVITRERSTMVVLARVKTWNFILASSLCGG